MKTENLPKNHPRYRSLLERHRLEEGVRKGLTSLQGLLAHGRGEAFDYLFGERTRSWARKAERAAAAEVLLARHPVLSVNGNTAALCPLEMIALARALGCRLEVNLFYGPAGRRKKIAAHFKELGEELLGAKPDAVLKGLKSNRARVDRRGIFKADVVLVPLEDGDRTEALRKAGKKVIAIDLNPLSRTARKADLTVVDHVARAVPAITREVKRFKLTPTAKLRKIALAFDNRAGLRQAIGFLSPKTKGGGKA